MSSHAILRAVIIEILQVAWRHWDRLEGHILLLLWSLSNGLADDAEVSHLTVHIAASCEVSAGRAAIDGLLCVLLLSCWLLLDEGHGRSHLHLLLIHHLFFEISNLFI